jgi:TPR repeat protein
MGMRAQGRRAPPTALVGAALALPLLASACATMARDIDCALSIKDGDATTCRERLRSEREARARRTQDAPACDRGDPAACDRVAAFDEQYGDVADAQQGYGRACDGGIAGSCRQLGLLHRDRKLARSDEAQARALLGRGCQLGDTQACAAGSDLAGDPAVRSALAERACVLGAARCASAGTAVAPADPARAARLFRRGCRAHDEEACAALGRQAVSAP